MSLPKRDKTPCIGIENSMPIHGVLPQIPQKHEYIHRFGKSEAPKSDPAPRCFWPDFGWVLAFGPRLSLFLVGFWEFWPIFGLQKYPTPSQSDSLW